MEGAPVTAATGVLGPVIVKLGALLGCEYRLRRQTRNDIQLIKSKLKSVHSILWATWEREILDVESKGLKKEALDLADDMQDAIDDFILTMEPSRRNKHMMVQSKIEASHRPFQEFKTRVDDVSGWCHSKWRSEKNKCPEPISSLFSRRNANSSASSKPPPFVRKDASELVGLDTWRKNIIGYLMGGEEGSRIMKPQLKMASIVGMAGVGKTTLASLVYEEIGNMFHCRAFVSVTPTPNMKGVLTSILHQLGAQRLAGTQARTNEDIIHIISNFLEDKRYLVIIDDIWHREEWDMVSKSFPENNLGSRIVMTTRIHSLPGDEFHNNKLCIRMNPWMDAMGTWVYGTDMPAMGTSSMIPMGKRPFFATNVHDMVRWISYMEQVTRMKPDMVGEGFDYDHRIVRMCGGVPLALLCMFSTTAMVVREQQEQLGEHQHDVKARDVQDMIEKQVKQSGIHNTPGFEPLVESLQLGYTDLPHHMLKTCLLYCSVYPENYPFHMNDLVMRWAAEGFIYKEDTGKGYFEELCNRGFMLDGKDSRGMSCYRMNPMMRNFLRWKSREDNFITCSSDITPPDACRIHRLCIDDYPDVDRAVEWVDPLLELDWSEIRSLVVFERARRYVPFERLERVRVLDLQYHLQQHEFKEAFLEPMSISKDLVFNALENHHVKDICGLLSLRHLFGLEGTGISEIPPEIARLQHLETLQLRFTWIIELPCEIGGLQHLKTLVVSRNAKLAKLPREIGDLQHLETLDLSYNMLTELPCEIGNLQNLENLNLHANRLLEEMPQEIGKLHHLKTLEAGLTRITRLGGEIGDLQQLETLDLSDNRSLTQLPREMGKLQNLKRLLLNGSQVVKIPKEIGGLKKLEILELELTICAIPWGASLLLKLEGMPECVRQAWKKSDLASELAGEILSLQMVNLLIWRVGLIVGRKHMHIPWWIKDHFNDLNSLDIRMCKLEEQDIKILREMPMLCHLTLRLEVVPREPIAISGEGFLSLDTLILDCRLPRVVTFQEGAMPKLFRLVFESQFYGGPPPPANKGDPQLGIGHLRSLLSVEFRCNEVWYGRAAESSPCMSSMIDIVRKEAQEHPNDISFYVTGRGEELFPAKQSMAGEVSSSCSSGSGANMR